MSQMKLKYTVWLLIIVSQTCWSSTDTSEKLCKNACCNCKITQGKEQANCTNRNLTSIPKGLGDEIGIIILDNNDFKVLEGKSFIHANLLNLKEVSLQYCKIEEVNSAAFEGLKNLMSIDLSNNQIKTLETLTFRDTEQLQVLKLNNNEIEKLEEDMFSHSKVLNTIELNGNKISFIGNKTFKFTKKLRHLKLGHNQLTYLDPSIFDNWSGLPLPEIQNNPWTCDCRLQTFFEQARNKTDYSTLFCNKPDNMKNKSWELIKSQDFVCQTRSPSEQNKSVDTYTRPNDSPQNVTGSLQQSTFPSILHFAIGGVIILILLLCLLCGYYAKKAATKKSQNNIITVNNDLTYDTVPEPKQLQLKNVNHVQMETDNIEWRGNLSNNISDQARMSSIDDLTEDRRFANVTKKLYLHSSQNTLQLRDYPREDPRFASVSENLSRYSSHNTLQLRELQRMTTLPHDRPDLQTYADYRTQTLPTNSSLLGNLDSTTSRHFYYPMQKMPASSLGYRTLQNLKTPANTNMTWQRHGNVTMPRQTQLPSRLGGSTRPLCHSPCMSEPMRDNLGPRTRFDGGSVVSLTRKSSEESLAGSRHRQPLQPTTRQYLHSREDVYLLNRNCSTPPQSNVPLRQPPLSKNDWSLFEHEEEDGVLV